MGLGFPVRQQARKPGYAVAVDGFRSVHEPGLTFGNPDLHSLPIALPPVWIHDISGFAGGFRCFRALCRINPDRSPETECNPAALAPINGQAGTDIAFRRMYHVSV